MRVVKPTHHEKKVKKIIAAAVEGMIHACCTQRLDQHRKRRHQDPEGEMRRKVKVHPKPTIIKGNEEKSMSKSMMDDPNTRVQS